MGRRVCLRWTVGGRWGSFCEVQLTVERASVSLGQCWLGTGPQGSTTYLLTLLEILCLILGLLGSQGLSSGWVCWKREQSWEMAAVHQKCHWQGHGVCWGHGPLLQVSHQISKCKQWSRCWQMLRLLNWTCLSLPGHALAQILPLLPAGSGGS